MRISKFFLLALLIFFANLVHAATRIGAVQGRGERTPLAGQRVWVQGVVTGDFQEVNQLYGFFLQDNGDGDARTSDGIFIYAPLTRIGVLDVRPGEVISLLGHAEEFNGQTQIGGVILMDRRGDVKPISPLALNWPLPAGVDAESYEGMLVTIAQTLTVTGNYELGRFGSLMLAANGRLFAPGNIGGNAAKLKSMAQENARRKLVLDDGSARPNPQPVPYLNENGTRRAGDTVHDLTGILSYGWDAYRIQPTAAPRFENANPRPAVPPQVGGDLRIMVFNVRNYFTTLRSQNEEARGAATATEFARQSAKLIAAVRAVDPDLLACVEIENNGDTAVRDFLTKLNAASKDAYAAVPLPKTGMGADAIRVAMLYKPAKLTPRGTSSSDTNRIFDRPPLAQTFVAKSGLVFTAVVNHFKSKSGCPETGDVDKGEGCWNLRRTAQASQLMAFIETLRESSGTPDILALGDFNAHTNELPLKMLFAGGLIAAGGNAPQRYSFVFDGQAGALDHAFTTPTLAPLITDIHEWHINADEPLLGDDAPDFYRSSDHDPLIIGMQTK